MQALTMSIVTCAWCSQNGENTVHTDLYHYKRASMLYGRSHQADQGSKAQSVI